VQGVRRRRIECADASEGAVSPAAGHCRVVGDGAEPAAVQTMVAEAAAAPEVAKAAAASRRFSGGVCWCRRSLVSTAAPHHVVNVAAASSQAQTAVL